MMFCSICGKYHDTTSAACPCISYTSMPVPPKTITCPHCGKEIIVEVKQ